MAAAVTLILGLLLPLATVWVFVLWGRPAIARARVEHEAVMIRDRIMDGILSGDIDKDDPRAVDALTYCKFLTNHSRELSLSVAFAVSKGMRSAGVNIKDKAQEKAAIRETVANATEGGSRRLQEAERELDNVIGTYFVRSSALWWLLTPLQRLSRYLKAREVVSEHDLSRMDPRPAALAAEVREASRGLTYPPALWTVHGAKMA